MFNSYITVNDAATALSEVTSNIGNTLLPNVFSNAELPNVDCINEELFFLSMYVIDGLIKNSGDESWAANREALAKHYYSKCATTFGEDLSTFVAHFLERVSFYNAAMMDHVSVASLPDRDDRLVATAVLVGSFFAELCGQPEDAQYKLIGGSAFGTLNLTTERLFQSTLIAH